MLRIGLTGNIGVGKTTVAALFAKRGVFVKDADRMVHEILVSPHVIWQQLVSTWGPSILLPGSSIIDRERLAELVFRDASSLRQHVGLIYPVLKEEVMREMDRACGKGVSIFMLDASQILEAGWEQLFDVIVLVRSPYDLCLARLSAKRGPDANRMRRRMTFQWPEWVKARYADFLIDNSGPMRNTERAVDWVCNRISGCA